MDGLGLGLWELPSFCYPFYLLVLFRHPPGKKFYLLVQVGKGSCLLQLPSVMKVVWCYEGLATLAMKVSTLAIKVVTLAVKVPTLAMRVKTLAIKVSVMRVLFMLTIS